MRSEIESSNQDGRTFTERARRAQIVEYAIETIAERGYARASLAEIARRAGVSKGLISYHFAGRAELDEQVFVAVTDAAEALMRPSIDAASGARAQLRAYITSNLEFMATRRAQIAALVEIANAVPREPGGQPSPYHAHYQDVLAQLEGVLRSGQRSGEMRRFSTRVMAVTIRAAIDAAGFRASADPNVDLIAYAGELAEAFDRATRATKRNAASKRGETA